MSKIATTARLPTRVPLRELCRVLGVSRSSYYAHWSGVFTPYEIDGGHLRFAADELAEAAKHPDPVNARAAVKLYRAVKGRL